MHLLLLRVAVALLPLVAAAALPAEEAKPVEGTLMMAGKTYRLAHTLAYETEVLGKPAYAVVASDQPIDVGAVTKALAESKGGDTNLRQPHVRVTFEKSGKVLSYYAYAAGFTTNGRGEALSGEVKLSDQRLTGKTKLELQGKGDLQRSFEFQFSAGLLKWAKGGK